MTSEDYRYPIVAEATTAAAWSGGGAAALDGEAEYEAVSSPTLPSRVLGANRTMDDILLSYSATSREEGLVVVRQICDAPHTAMSTSLHDLEKAVRVFTNHNSAYVNVEEQDFAILADEVLNNRVLSVLVFAGHSPRIGDFEICSLCRAMQYNVSVEALTLSGLNVSDEAIGLLCEALLHSRVTYLDFSNTPLEDEAGRSIAALAHMNPYLRTVVVSSTLIAEEIQDEIDVACQFNQSNFESNQNRMDEQVFREGEVDRLRQRLVQVIRVKEKKILLCVAHLFECCPNGEFCVYSHDLRHSSLSGADLSFQQTLAEMFANGKDGWEDALVPLPQDGASWRPPSDAEDEEDVDVEGGGSVGMRLSRTGRRRGGPRINLKRRLALKREQEEQRRRAERQRQLLFGTVLPLSLLTVTLSVGTLVWCYVKMAGRASRSSK